MKRLALVALAAGTLLAGCNLTPPFDAFLTVNNTTQLTEEGDITSSLCVGGLRAALSVGGVTVETPTVLLDETSSIHYSMPLPVGALITAEAWCYGDDNAEIGDSKISKAHTNTNIPTVNAFAPQTPDIGTAHCVPTVETRGFEVCIVSSMFD